MLFLKNVEQVMVNGAEGHRPAPGTEGLEETVYLHDRPVALRLTPAARQALLHRSRPLNVELELLFSCFIRKRVRFPEDPQPVGGAARLAAGEHLRLRFNPVMSRHCTLAEGHELTAFPIVEAGPFVPHWVHLDHTARAGWSGEFGYAAGRH
jgi:hypothetical protein